jgi:uncharacterized membrane protein
MKTTLSIVFGIIGFLLLAYGTFAGAAENTTRPDNAIAFFFIGVIFLIAGAIVANRNRQKA